MTCLSLAQRLRRVLLPGLSVVLVSGVLCAPVSAQDGLLDLGFGRPGVFTQFGTRESGILDVVVQPDGRIVAAGYASVGEDEKLFALTRYKADGSLDASFGVEGKTVTPFGTKFSIAIALALQPDGKIVAAGEVIDPFAIGAESIALARYNPDGTLDRTFGGGRGVVVTRVPDADTGAFDIDLDADGGILLLGLATTNYALPDGSQVLLAHYRADGTLDTGFGEGGLLRVFPHHYLGGVTGGIQADGTVVAADFDPQTHRLRASRFNRDGSADRTFNEGRAIDAELPVEVQRVTDVTIQADGKVVILGSGTFATAYDRSGTVPSNSSDIFLARLNADGTRDARFGRAGIMVTDVPLSSGPTRTISSHATIQRDGKLLVASTLVPSSETYQLFAALLRYGTDGELDPSFGNNGVVIASYSDPSRTPYEAEPSALVVQDDGKIILAGRAVAPGSDRGLFDFSLLRFENASIRPPASAARAR